MGGQLSLECDSLQLRLMTPVVIRYALSEKCNDISEALLLLGDRVHLAEATHVLSEIKGKYSYVKDQFSD